MSRSTNPVQVWVDAPPKIVELRRRLGRAATIKALFGTSFRFHYPDADPSVHPLPYAVLHEEIAEARRAAPAESEVHFQLLAVFYFDETKHTVGAVEKALYQAALDVIELGDVVDEDDGLFIVTARRLRASDPKRSSQAAAVDDDSPGKAYRTCTMVFEGGDY